MSNIVHLIEKSEINNQILNLAIEQGKTFNKLSLFYPENISTGVFYGQIRRNYYQDDGELLGNFEFETAIYDEVENKTLIKPYLTAETTQDIPYTKYQGLGTTNIKNCWVYDIEYHINNIVLPIVRGFVQVIAEVTR